ncbi:polysaccharide export outer membrane protein [Sulfitobacter marinus]|uniref:Polysaccharide export outer membrane protein n=1 Tax=Sulfitobacter marinus TaxID=394264 RepID=A0A1I6VC68_9RHOB|nr:polysaccharide biosynthesis/export family protein [Sulfitobacter marinus]SFT11232.1 polysaccharide export outer membrane protein [Sulfitobacter marinus]
MRRLSAWKTDNLCRIALLCIGMVLGASSLTAQPYHIRAGDVLLIEVLEDPELNRSVLVTPDGRISVPMAGTMRASGQPIEAIQRGLAGRLDAAFTNPPTVFVSVQRLADPRLEAGVMTQPKLISIYVMGEANSPGMLKVPKNTNVLQAFAAMGGFTKFAAIKRIQLRRAATIIPLNYRQIEAGAQEAHMQLREGDVIVVPQRRLFE